MRNTKALYPLALLIFLGAALMVFIMAADEQNILSNGASTPDAVSLKGLIARSSATNTHLQLADFYIGKPFIYTAKLVQFRDVYLPLFPLGEREDATNLHVLLWIRNDRNSNERLIESEADLERFVEELNRNPRSVTGVLRNPVDRVRSLTSEAYPGVDSRSLKVLWARRFPTQSSVSLMWGLVALCLTAAAVCGAAYRRQMRAQR